METYKTKDIYEASALIAMKMRIVCLEKEGSVFWFVFDLADECTQIANDYWNGGLEICAKDYSDAIRSLKDRIFANK